MGKALSEASRWLAALPIAGFAVAWFALALGPLRLGPVEWDDAQYMELAETGEGVWFLRNRYVHIWALRLFSSLVQPRALAASLYSTSLVVGLSLVGYALARRSAGRGAGLLALFCMPLFPPLLRYLTTAHVDLTLALWSLLTLACVATALQSESPRNRLGWALLAGTGSFFALESKEPGMCVAPIALYYLARHTERDRRGTLLAFAGGATLGMLALGVLDLCFGTTPGFYSTNPLQYFGNVPVSAAKAVVGSMGDAAASSRKFRMRREFFGQLTEPSFLAFSLLGMAGAARGFARNRVVQMLTALCLSTLLFSVLIASYAWDIEANDRYVLLPGAALVVLAALFVHSVFREPGVRTDVAWLAPMLVALLGGTLCVALAQALGARSPYLRSAAFFCVPAAIGVGFIGLFLGPAAWLARFVVTAMLALSMLASVGEARDHVARVRPHMARWQQLADASDAAGVRVRVWHAAGYPPERVRRRLRALSRRAAAQVHVSALGDGTQLGAGEWIFTAGQRSAFLETVGMQRVGHSLDGGKKSWSVYRR